MSVLCRERRFLEEIHSLINTNGLLSVVVTTSIMSVGKR